MTAEWLFTLNRIDVFSFRYPDARLKLLLADVDEALDAANNWSNSRLVDYPKRQFVREIAGALREAGIPPTAASRGPLARCTEIAFAALGKTVRSGAGMTRTYRAALKDLRDITTEGKAPA